MKDGLIEKIKSRAYWRVNFRPLRYERRLDSLQACEELVTRNSVEKRGWDYPHIPRRVGDDTGIELGDGFVQGWVDWQDMKELWKMYESGQFIHLFALNGEWPDERTLWGVEASPNPKRTSVGLIEINWKLCEIYEFLARLAIDSLYDEGVEVSIKLFQMEGRSLEAPASRYFFRTPRTTAAKELIFNETYSRADLSDARELSLAAIKRFYDRFGWNPTDDQVKADQEELYKLKMGRG